LITALKTITAELPPDGKVAATACAKLTPKLLAQIQNVSKIPVFVPYPSLLAQKKITFIQELDSKLVLDKTEH